MLYSILPASTIHQHESVTGIQMSLLSGSPLLFPTPSHPSPLSQSPGLSSLYHTANSHGPPVQSEVSQKGKTNIVYCGGGSLVTKSCPTLATPWTVVRQAPLSMGCSRQKYWSGLPFPSPGDLADPGTDPRPPASQVDSGIADGFLTD